MSGVNDYVVSLIRTYVPMLTAALLVWVGQVTGILIVMNANAKVTVVLVVTGLWYALARTLERRWPQLGWLLGSKRTPTY